MHKGVAVQPSPSSDPDAEKEEEERYSPSCGESSDDEEQPANPADASEEKAASEEEPPEAGYAVDGPSDSSNMLNSFQRAMEFCRGSQEEAHQAG